MLPVTTEHTPPLPPDAAALTFDTAGVATALGLTPGYFRTIRSRLEARGFPRRLPGLGQRWSRRAVTEWIDGAGGCGADRLTVDPSALQIIDLEPRGGRT